MTKRLVAIHPLHTTDGQTDVGRQLIA